jgi:hypothetical protein
MYWTLQNLKDSGTSSKYCIMVQYLAPLHYINVMRYKRHRVAYVHACGCRWYCHSFHTPVRRKPKLNIIYETKRRARVLDIQVVHSPLDNVRLVVVGL